MCTSTNTDVVCGNSFLAHKLREFYSEEVIRHILVPLLDQSSPVSLRTLDWLVVNYSKKHNVVCKTKEGQNFNIFNGYKVALSVYRRTHFDPFRRRSRHTFTIDGKERETTLGQTNFVYWAYINGVLEYAHTHAKDIEEDMNSFAASHKMKLKNLKARGIIHKRTALTKTNATKCHVYHTPSTIKFS